MSTEVEGVRCRCGGKLQERASEVEFFGIDFGVKKVESCTERGTEYLPQETMEEVEAEVRKRGLFGLERRGKVSKRNEDAQSPTRCLLYLPPRLHGPSTRCLSRDGVGESDTRAALETAPCLDQLRPGSP